MRKQFEEKDGIHHINDTVFLIFNRALNDEEIKKLYECDWTLMLKKLRNGMNGPEG